MYTLFNVDISRAKIRRALALLFVAGILNACSDNGSLFFAAEPGEEPPEPISFNAQLVRTTNGVPHIQADDWGSLGYGFAYAYAQDNYCVLMKEVVAANGQTQRYFGDDGDIKEDFVFALIGEDVQDAFIDAQPVPMQELMRGYAEGLNRYLADTGVANLAQGDEGCRDAPWVRPVTTIDLAKVLRKLTVRASTDPLAEFIFDQQGPPAEPAARAVSLRANDDAREFSLGDIDITALGLPKVDEVGSNAYALGSTVTDNERGMLLGNPHFPWQGSNRFYMAHLTMGDEYDVMGAALHGFPLISIGFNKDVAWTHTVSTGSRFVMYELTLNPANNMQYEYDGEMRDITTRTVTIDVQGDNGVEQQSHTFYFSQFGPIVDLGGFNSLLAGWPNAAGTLLTLKDVNLDNARGLDQWRRMGAATSIAELNDALGSIGIPWVNTIAADRNGTAFYGDISAVPNVSDAMRPDCIQGLVAPLLTENGVTTLDGSTSDCELGTDASAPVAGVFGSENLPSLTTDTWAGNANDSYWLSNPDQLLTGFAEIIGPEEIEQSIRTRATFSQAEQRLAGTDGLGTPGFTLDNLRTLMFSSRNHAAELTKPAVVALCNAESDWATFTAGLDPAVTVTPAQMDTVCAQLDSWDSRHNIDSRGAHIFTEFWRIARSVDDFWSVPFDPADPVNTPRALNTANATVVADVKEALVRGVQVLVDNNIALDAAWGDVQFSERNGVRIPIHGGSGAMMFSVISANLVADEGYSDIRAGNSYMQAVTWDDSECPDAYALLSYSQSTDPDSSYYADQTLRYSQKDWVDMAFCAADVDAARVGEPETLTAEVLP